MRATKRAQGGKTNQRSGAPKRGAGAKRATTSVSAGRDAPPRGRRPGPNLTRDAVLAAARESFAERGYQATTIRAVAARAGVDPALVMQYFGSKDGLFEAAIEFPFDASQLVARIVEGPKSRIGERMVASFLSLWDSPEFGPQMVGLLRSAASDAKAAKRLRQVVEGEILRPVAESIGVPDAHLRADLVGSQLVGLGFARHLVGLDRLQSVPQRTVISWIAPTIQRYLTGQQPPMHGGSQ